MRAVWIFITIQLIALIDAKTLPSNGLRIVGGQEVEKNIPYLVTVTIGQFFCGGSLISLQCVLTAAHCVYKENPKIMSVRAGSKYRTTGGGTRNVENATCHENYNTRTFHLDVAILKLKTAFPDGRTDIRPIAVAVTEPPTGAEVIAAGWGNTKENGSPSNVTQEVKLNIVSRPDCQNMYKNSQITMAMICASGTGKDSCHGDSGGPLTYNGTVCGIVSFGIGCARPEYPGVYSNTAAVNMKKFITEYMKNNS